MIQRVYERCLMAVPKEKVFIATDDERIMEVVHSFGGQPLMTPSYCLTGTDRVAEVAKRINAEYYINVQGDEPLFNPNDITACLNACQNYPGELVNGYAPISEERLYRSLSTPKVVFRPDGRLLYMSRSPIPSNKKDEYRKGFRQICVYGFPKNALLDFSEYGSKTPLEEDEDIEILRFLEMGYEVRMIELSDDSIAVDHPEDIERVLKRLNGSNSG